MHNIYQCFVAMVSVIKHIFLSRIKKNNLIYTHIHSHIDMCYGTHITSYDAIVLIRNFFP